MKILLSLILVAAGHLAFASNNDEAAIRANEDKAAVANLDAESVAFLLDNSDPAVLQAIGLRTTGEVQMAQAQPGKGAQAPGSQGPGEWGPCIMGKMVSGTPVAGWHNSGGWYLNPRYEARRAQTGSLCRLRN